MKFFKKGAKSLGKMFKKANHTATKVFKKGSSVAHKIGTTMDKVAGSTVGQAILDYVPEGHAIYNVARAGIGGLDKGLSKVGQLSEGIEDMTKAKSLDSALKQSDALYDSGKSSLGRGKTEFRKQRGELEKFEGYRKGRDKAKAAFEKGRGKLEKRFGRR